MNTTFEDATAIAERLTPVEKIRLVKYLAQSLEGSGLEGKQPIGLRGSWKVDFPEPFDLDKEIREIRDDWKKKFGDL